VYAYLGSPHESLFDQGTEVISEFVRARCVEMGIHLVFAPVESHSSLGLVKRMYGPIRRIYYKLLLDRTADRTQLGPQPKEHMLATATKSLNDTAVVNGLVLTILVFGVRPHVILDVKKADDSFPTHIHMMYIARDDAEKSLL
jgi:NADH:ubiquinone oxidoreductase subunit 4 (subunit M)